MTLWTCWRGRKRVLLTGQKLRKSPLYHIGLNHIHISVLFRQIRLHNGRNLRQACQPPRHLPVMGLVDMMSTG